MTAKTTQGEWQSEAVSNWLLAMLRFAVTRSDADRICVLETAKQMDRAAGNPSFSFFVRASAEICTAIATDDSAERQATLTRYFSAIDDRRLREALKGATLSGSATPAFRNSATRTREYLWRGLGPHRPHSTR